MAQHLFVELVAQRGQRSRVGLGICVFRFEIRLHFRVLFFAEPCVVVGQHPAMQACLSVVFACNRRKSLCLSHVVFSVVVSAASATPLMELLSPPPRTIKIDESFSPPPLGHLPAASGWA